MEKQQEPAGEGSSFDPGVRSASEPDESKPRKDESQSQLRPKASDSDTEASSVKDCEDHENKCRNCGCHQHQHQPVEAKTKLMKSASEPDQPKPKEDKSPSQLHPKASDSDTEASSVKGCEGHENKCRNCGCHQHQHQPVEAKTKLIKSASEPDESKPREDKSQSQLHPKAADSDTEASSVKGCEDHENKCRNCGCHQQHQHQPVEEKTKVMDDNDDKVSSSQDVTYKVTKSKSETMDKQQEPAGEGSSVDPGDKSASEPDESKPREDESQSQAADSEASSIKDFQGYELECPHCKQTFTVGEYPPNLTPPDDQTTNVTEGHKKGWKNTFKDFKERFFSHHSTVMVFSVVTGETFDAHLSILEQLKSVMLPTTKLKESPGLQECDIAIIFCPVTSRAGSDVEASLMTMTGEKPVILVVMHHTRKPKYSAKGKKWCETYPNIKLEVPVLYHETESGLLKCQTNNKAVSEIKKTLCQYSQ